MNKDFPNLIEANFDTLTPAQVRIFARHLNRELGLAQLVLEELQGKLAVTESDLSYEMARSRLMFGNMSRPDGKNYTETQKEDEALIANAQLASAYAVDKATVEIYKGKINVLKSQSDLVRSVMVSIRTEIEIDGSSN